MANNKQGGAKLVETMIKKHGSYEAYKQSMRERASRGGKNGNTGGFAFNRDIARSAGATGGKYSRKGYKMLERTETYGTYRRKSDGEIVEFRY